MCQHKPACPSAEDTDREAAVVVAAHPDQGWLCNAVITCEDTVDVLPTGETVPPHRPLAPAAGAQTVAA